jgi:hypothetical protein
VATDGHRLARYEMPLPAGAENIPGVIIPRKTVMEIRKLVDEAADNISMELSENKVKFSFDHIVLTSKLIDGTFPDYQKVIPSLYHHFQISRYLQRPYQHKWCLVDDSLHRSWLLCQPFQLSLCFSVRALLIYQYPISGRSISLESKNKEE